MKLEYIRLGDNIDRYLNSIYPSASFIEVENDNKKNDVYKFITPVAFLDIIGMYLIIRVNKEGVIIQIEFRTENATSEASDLFVQKAKDYYGLAKIKGSHLYKSNKDIIGLFSVNHTSNDNSINNGWIKIVS